MLELVEDLAGMMLEPEQTLRALGEKLQLLQLPSLLLDGDGVTLRSQRLLSSKVTGQCVGMMFRGQNGGIQMSC